MTRAHSIVALISSLALVFGVAAAGGMFTAESVTSWYPTLAKPPLNPPNWVFGPVWTILYIAMAVAAWRIWKTHTPPARKREALAVYGLQLLLNLAWSYFFFYRENPFAGVVVIVLLWTMVAMTLILFSRIDPLSKWLLTPYLLWVSFASYLNVAIWVLNA